MVHLVTSGPQGAADHDRAWHSGGERGLVCCGQADRAERLRSTREFCDCDDGILEKIEARCRYDVKLCTSSED